jgi:hypothetical protein
MSAGGSARFSLLDQQLVDVDGLAFGRIDDVELACSGSDPPVIAALLTGTEALGERLGGTAGRMLAAASARLRPPSAPSGPTRIDAELIAELEPLVRLSVHLRELPHVAGLERWLARHAVSRLPGAGDAPE